MIKKLFVRFVIEQLFNYQCSRAHQHSILGLMPVLMLGFKILVIIIINQRTHLFCNDPSNVVSGYGRVAGYFRAE